MQLIWKEYLFLKVLGKCRNRQSLSVDPTLFLFEVSELRVV